MNIRNIAQWFNYNQFYSEINKIDSYRLNFFHFHFQLMRDDPLHSTLSQPSTSSTGLLSIDVSHGILSPPTPPKTPQNQPITAQSRSSHSDQYRLPSHHGKMSWHNSEKNCFIFKSASYFKKWLIKIASNLYRHSWTFNWGHLFTLHEQHILLFLIQSNKQSSLYSCSFII